MHKVKQQIQPTHKHTTVLANTAVHSLNMKIILPEAIFGTRHVFLFLKLVETQQSSHVWESTSGQTLK